MKARQAAKKEAAKVKKEIKKMKPKKDDILQLAEYLLSSFSSLVNNIDDEC